MKTLVLAAALLGLTLVAAPAQACCHVYELRQDAGPCYAEWEGDGFRLRTDHVEVGCAGLAHRVTP